LSRIEESYTPGEFPAEPRGLTGAREKADFALRGLVPERVLMAWMPDSGASIAVAPTCVGLWLIGVLGCAACTNAAARSKTGSGLACAAAVLLAVLAPLGFPHEWVITRFVFAAGGVLIWFRTLDLRLRSPPLPFWTRLWLLVGVFDVRRATRVKPGLDRGEARWLVVHAAATVGAGLVIVQVAPRFDGASHWLVRWSFGVVFCYAMVEAVHSTLVIGYRLVGVALPRINDFPIRSTSLAEFWGRRWNRVVAGWLRDYLFFPLARREHVTLGICAAFAGSTVIHFWIAWLPLDLAGALTMASFFVVQAAGSLLERRLGIDGWPPPRRRAWTVAWLLLSAPLFVEPALQIYLGPR
jgi:hypothetical protein